MPQRTEITQFIFGQPLSDAEGEYARCKKFFPDTKAWLPGHIPPHIDESALFSRVAMNVLNLAGYESTSADAETLVLAKVIETAAMAKLVEAPEKPDRTLISDFGCLKNFGELVERASAAVDVYESDGLSLPQVLAEAEAYRRAEAAMRITTSVPDLYLGSRTLPRNSIKVG